jgi:hypothetical protein
MPGERRVAAVHQATPPVQAAVEPLASSLLSSSYPPPIPSRITSSNPSRRPGSFSFRVLSPSGVAAAASKGVLLKQSRPCSHGVSAVEVDVLSRCVSLSLSLKLAYAGFEFAGRPAGDGAIEAHPTCPHHRFPLPFSFKSSSKGTRQICR